MYCCTLEWRLDVVKQRWQRVCASTRRGHTTSAAAKISGDLEEMEVKKVVQV